MITPQDIIAVLTGIGALVGAIGGAISIVLSARAKAKNAEIDQKFKSMESALQIERNIQEALKKRIIDLELEVESSKVEVKKLEEKILKYKLALDKKDDHIQKLESELNNLK